MALSAWEIRSESFAWRRFGGGPAPLDHWMILSLTETKKDDRQERVTWIREALGPRSIVLIGLMGAGKTAVGRRLASRLELPFIDADSEIEASRRGHDQRDLRRARRRPISGRESAR